MSRYVLALNPDDILYARSVEEFFKTHGDRIDSVCIFPSLASSEYRKAHLLANFRVLGFKDFLPVMFKWIFRRDRITIRKAAARYGVPVFDIRSVNSEEFYQHLKSRSIPAVLNICSQIYKKETIDRLPPIYNFHGGYVPGNAGRFPVFWAYMKNLPQVVTCHRVSEVVDGGTPLLHYPVPTDSQDSVWSITEKIMRLFPEIMRRSIQLIGEGKSETMNLNIPEIYGPRPTQKDVSEYRKLLHRGRSARP